MAQTFSNADTGSKTADPYKSATLDNEVPLSKKIEDLSAFMSAAKYAMMTTRKTQGNLVSRCMALAGKESGDIDLLFHTNTESGKTDDLVNDQHVNIAFLNAFGEWASISGSASIETDRELVRKHYSQLLKAWLGDLGDGKHDGGPEDPRIGIIRVRAQSATYQISSKNTVAQVAEVAKGALTGKVASVNKTREITADEIEMWRSAHS